MVVYSTAPDQCPAAGFTHFELCYELKWIRLYLLFTVTFNFWVMPQKTERAKETGESGHVVKITRNDKALASVLPTTIVQSPLALIIIIVRLYF